MELSQDTLNFLEVLDKYTEGKLRKKNDIGSLFELAATHDGLEEIQELVFKGKVIWNLFSKIKSSTPETEGIEFVQNEFESNVKFYQEQLKKFEEVLPEELKTRFNDTYFQMTKGSVLNVVDLAHDFARVKDLQSEKK